MAPALSSLPPSPCRSRVEISCPSLRGTQRCGLSASSPSMSTQTSAARIARSLSCRSTSPSTSRGPASPAARPLSVARWPSVAVAGSPANQNEGARIHAEGWPRAPGMIASPPPPSFLKQSAFTTLPVRQGPLDGLWMALTRPGYTRPARARQPHHRPATRPESPDDLMPRPRIGFPQTASRLLLLCHAPSGPAPRRSPTTTLSQARVTCAPVLSTRPRTDRPRRCSQ
jgi:hypothetical protein